MNLQEKQLIAAKHPKLYEEIKLWWRVNGNEILRENRIREYNQSNKSNSIDD